MWKKTNVCEKKNLLELEVAKTSDLKWRLCRISNISRWKFLFFNDLINQIFGGRLNDLVINALWSIDQSLSKLVQISLFYLLGLSCGTIHTIKIKIVI